MMTKNELIEFCLFTVFKDIKEQKNKTTFVGVLARENMSTDVENLKVNFKKVFPYLSFDEFLGWGLIHNFLLVYPTSKGDFCYFKCLNDYGFRAATVNNIPYGHICWGGLGLGGVIQDPAVNSVILVVDDQSTLEEYQSQFPERKDKRRDVMIYMDSSVFITYCVQGVHETCLDLSLRQRYEDFLEKLK